MSTKTDGTPTPEAVETHATEQASLGRIALLGIFGAADDPSALVRLPRGITQTVTVGDTVAGGTVAAIGEDQLVLSRLGAQQVLRMPQG